MGLLDYFNPDAHNQVNSGHHGDITHELLAAAASYEAAKAYENHVAANGPPDSHAKAKELLAAFAGAAVDQLVESKGLDFIDKEKAKHQAKTEVDTTFTEEAYVSTS